MNRGTVVCAAALALVALTGGNAFTQIDDDDAAGRAGAQPPGAADRRVRSLDDRFVEIEERAPGFGGLFRDAAGRLTAYLLDMREAAAVEEAVADLVGADEVTRTGGLRMLPGDYAFTRLVAWRRQAGAVHAIPGVALTDVDEAANRLRIGIEREEARVPVELELDRIGIPREAVNVEVTGPIFALATLQDMFRPVIGGIQITFDCDMQGCFVCTDGFLVVRNGTKGLITNSHCTSTQGGVQKTFYSQPLPGSSTVLNKIGTETADPAYFTGGQCPVSRRCRFSDSAFVKRKKKVGWSRGLIARPDSIGSLTMTSASQRFRITGEVAGPMVGETVNKVGRTTGWSQGDISATCADVNVSSSDITLLCQDAVDAAVGGGDSGSPVFAITSGNDVSLDGILWGGNGNGTLFIFSPLAGIQQELGTLRTCDLAFGC
ncbi:MAG TPA: hypothetical protein VGK94_12520 [Candidatus Polarisedimenticolia bacterium]